MNPFPDTLCMRGLAMVLSVWIESLRHQQPITALADVFLCLTWRHCLCISDVSVFVFLLWLNICSVVLPSGRSSLGPAAVVLDLIDSPDGTLDILHAHEALVEGQIVPNGVLLSHHIHRTQQARTQTKFARESFVFLGWGGMICEKKERKKKIQCSFFLNLVLFSIISK